MAKLFLSSSFKDVAYLFQNFEKDYKGKSVTFIPTASLVEKMTFYVKSGKKVLEKLGMTIDELEVSTASIDEISTKLLRNDYIYISGGNTFFLMQELKKSGADEIIIEQVNAGKFYIGESAGSMITSPNIEYAGELDSVKKAPELTSYEGLGFVNFYTVPHHTNAPFKKAVERLIDKYDSSLVLRPISNKQAITIDSMGVEVVTMPDVPDFVSI